MAQQLLHKYRDGILATGLTAVCIPVLKFLDSKSLLASQVILSGIQLGTQSWVAGIGGPSMFANLDEITFANIQAVLFPRLVYFTLPD